MKLLLGKLPMSLQDRRDCLARCLEAMNEVMPLKAVYLFGSHARGDARPDSDVRLTAKTASRIMVVGGEPLGRRHIWWNFVSSSKERIEQGKRDWAEGRFAKVPGDDEFIPLPER